MRNSFILLFCLSLSSLFAQNSQSFWRAANESFINANPDERSIVPNVYETVQLDVPAMRAALREAPMEFSAEAALTPLLLDMPMPDGSYITFAVTESPLFEPGLGVKFPKLKSYSGYSTSEQGVKLRFVLTSSGFSGAMTKLSTLDVFYIDRYANNQTEYYITYNVNDHQSNIPAEHLTCGVEDSAVSNNPTFVGTGTNTNTTTNTASSRAAGDIVSLRTYRIAITTTGEWGDDFSTVEEVVNRILEGVSRLNQIFEVDLGLRVILVENNDLLVFQNPATDPYLDSNASGQMIGQNTEVINSIVGVNNYDFGHLFDNSCDTGGLASLGAVCGGNKGSAITCHYSNDFEYMMVRVTAHEIGHSFGASHTWNLCEIGSTDNMNSGTAYEPGSGNTIMSYHGVCQQSQDVTEGAHDYYHANSLESIYNFIESSGGNCPETVTTDNHFPDINLPYTNGFYIPISTPFELKADGTDMDNDMLTYCWEQYNLSSENTPLGSPTMNEPSFRSFPPTLNPKRVFPKMQNVVQNTNSVEEVLPAYTRNLTFRCSVRDNNPIIGVAVWDEVSFEATNTAGPFKVSHPNTNTTWTVGDYTEVTWDVANTDNNLVDCHFVNILLSTDGGYNYPVTLISGVPNDGSHFVVVPQQVSNTVRVRVEAADNIFFDISNTNFSIQEDTIPGYNFDAGPYTQQVCLPDAANIDLPMISILGFDDAVTFTASGMPNGAVANFSNNPASPISGTALSIDMSNAAPVSGIFEVVITGMIEGVDTITRTIYLDVVSNDFSTLALSGPSYGALNQSQTPTFTWATASDAISYEFQLATNPSFAENTIVDEQIGLTGPPFMSTVLLEKSTPYYWRVRPVNAFCGPGPYTSTSAFHTEVLSCANYPSTSPNIPIATQLNTVVESGIDILTGGTIVDLNVTKIKGTYDLVKDIAVSVLSPQGTEIELFSGICPGSNTAIFNLGIDDNAAIPITCPPNSGAPMRPEVANALAGFNGENSEGTWRMKVKVINNNGSGGVFQEWALQVCSNQSLSAPFLVNNELLLVPPGAFNYIFTDKLLADDNDTPPTQVEFTLMEAPTEGDILFNGVPVPLGGTFRQATINAGNLTYQHNAGAGLTDQFVFTVSDGDGGWIPPTVFNIQMDEDAVVSTTDLSDVNTLLVFPNPTKDVLNVKLAKPVAAAVVVNLYNIQGQLIATQAAKTGLDLIQFDMNNWSAGLYFVEWTMNGQRLVEKVAVYE